jgi:23S rRNA pseudouridine2605 synthase
MRLAKYLAHSGVASRRGAQELIAAGRVAMDGLVVTDPARDVDESVEVRVDGRVVVPEEREVWILNKPAGVVSTAAEPGRRRAVTELVRSSARLYPVGRLDVDSTGLILLTNDGELANRLTHPRYEVPRTYRAELRRPPADRDLRRMERGLELEDGPTAPAWVRRVGEREIEITIREGRNRQVRRMVEAIGNDVTRLARVRFGPFELAGLAPGESRRLGPDEVERLWKDARSMYKGRGKRRRV